MRCRGQISRHIHSEHPRLRLVEAGGGATRLLTFCHYAGNNYVSCSPFRVPIARLAAAQAALKEKGISAK